MSGRRDGMTWAGASAPQNVTWQLVEQYLFNSTQLRRWTLEALVQEMVNDIQFLGTQSLSTFIFPRRMPKPRHGDQLIE